MKKQIIKALKQIKKTAEATGMTGTIYLSFSCHVDEWDKALASITEFKMYRHYAEISDKLSVGLLLN